MAIFISPQQRSLLDKVKRERAEKNAGHLSRFLQEKAANQRLEPLVREYEEILKIQKLMDEIEGKKS